MLTQETVSRLKSEIAGQVRLDESMSLHTSFHIGGPADALIVPADREDVRKVLRIAREEKHRSRLWATDPTFWCGTKEYAVSC